MSRPAEASATRQDELTIGVSIPIPTPFGPYLQDRRTAYGDPLGAVTPAHVTLLGPTVVPQSDLRELTVHLADVARDVSPFVMTLRGTGTFRPVSDVVFVHLARGISGTEQLELGIRKGRWGAPLLFPFHPHVTVAHDVTDELLDQAFEELADFYATFEVRAFDLYVKDDDGRWVPDREFPLGEGDR